MLGTRGPGVQDNGVLWINVSVFAYNTTVSSSTEVTPHYMEHPGVQACNPEYPSRLSSVVFRSENHPWNQSQAEIVLGGTILSVEADSSSLGGDKTNVLSRRRKIGESRRVKTLKI